MADQPTDHFDPIEALIDGYLDGTLTEAQHDELFARLESDRALLKRFAELTELDAILHEHAGNQIEAEQVRSQMLLLAQDPQSPAAARLFEEADCPLLDDAAMPQIQWSYHSGSKPQNITLGVIGYVGRQVLRRYTAGIAGAAALLVLAVILVLVFSGHGDGPIETELTINEPPTPAVQRPVATLTDERDAVWDRRPGQDLYAGQRFTLTHGYAEITTARGAVAVLEAPTTIELLDNDNALRLSAGKLVGICETSSSKGFLVRTSYIDVIDTGTRFGIASNDDAGSVVHVFEGSVTTKPSLSSDEEWHARTLWAGESQAIDSNGKETDPEAVKLSAFAGLAWRIAGITEYSGQVQWVDSAAFLSKDSTSWPKQDQAVVMTEKRGFSIKKPLELSIVSSNLSEAVTAVAPGTTISTYILLYNPEGPTPSVAQGKVVFEGEILGIVINGKWRSSDRVLRDGPEDKLFGNGGEPGLIEQNDSDRLDLLPDGHTFSFKLKAGQAHDAVRVVVREPTGGQQ